MQAEQIARFRDLLEERVMELQRIISATDELEPLMVAFSGLRGVASTVGCEAISQDSEDCEAVCIDAMDAGRGLEQKEYAWLNEVVERAIDRIQLPRGTP